MRAPRLLQVSMMSIIYKYKIFLFAVLILSFETSAKVFIENGELFYSGMITHDHNIQYFKLYNNIRINKLHITSRGGSVEDGIELGNFIYQNNIEIEVQSFCFSSCANYVVPAAASFSLANNALIAWHGGSFQTDSLSHDNQYLTALASVQNLTELDTFLTTYEASMLVKDKVLLKSEYQFMKKVGLNPAFLIYGHFKMSRIKDGITYVGWSFTDTVLKTIFTNFEANNERIPGLEMLKKRNIYLFNNYYIETKHKSFLLGG